MQTIIDFFRSIFTLGGHFDWSVVQQYLFDSTVIQGAEITVVLAVLAQVTGAIIGLLLYLLRRSRIVVLRGFAEIYIWFFRGTPLLVQLLFLFNLFPVFHLVRPLNSSNFFANLGFPQVTEAAFLSAFLAFSFNEGAYMAEIVRAGIDSIDPGQMEAAKSLGMTYGQAMQRIILPQAARVILPPLGNEFNSMLKTTSLAGAFALTELYLAASSIGQSLFRPLELAVVLSAWYLLMTTIWGFIQQWIERRLNASNLDQTTTTSFIDRLLGRGGKPQSKESVTDVLQAAGRR
jgi:polar amino acid transport system permease protein